MAQKKREKSWLKHAAVKKLTERERELLSRISRGRRGAYKPPLHFRTAEAKYPEETKRLLELGLIERRGLLYIEAKAGTTGKAGTPAVAPVHPQPAPAENDVAAVMGGRLRPAGEAAGEAKPRPPVPPMPRPISNALQIDQSTPEGKEQWERLEHGLCPNNHEDAELQIDGFRYGVLNLMCTCGFKTQAGINSPTGEAVLTRHPVAVHAIRAEYNAFVANKHRRGRKLHA